MHNDASPFPSTVIEAYEFDWIIKNIKNNNVNLLDILIMSLQ